MNQTTPQTPDLTRVTINNLFPSPFLKAADLADGPLTLTIRGVDPRHEIKQPDGSVARRPLVRFQETEQSLILNKTNALSIANLYGPEVSRWIGRSITLYSTMVSSFGAMVPAIRIKEVMPL